MTLPFIRRALYWIGHFLLYATIVVIVLSILGALVAMLLGSILTPEHSLAFLFKKGISIGARYACVWAGGLSIVTCIMKAHRLRQIRAAQV